MRGAPSGGRDRRVVIVVTDSRWGGTPLKLARLAEGVAARGWEVLFVSLMPPGKILDDLEHKGIATASLRLRSILGGPLSVLQLRSLIKKHNPVVVQSALWHANLLTRIACAGLDVGVISGHESVDEDKSRFRVLLERATLRLADSHFAVAPTVARTMSLRDRIPIDQVSIIPNAVEVPKEKSDGSVFRKLWGIPEDAPIVGWVGRLDPVKDLEVLFEAVGMLPDWWLVLVGDGEQRDRLYGWARAHGIQGRLVFTGELDDATEVLSAFDVFCLVSRWEGLPTALMEAMAAGLPVVAPAVGGIIDLIEHEQDGLLVHDRDPRSFADAIGKARGRSDLAARAREKMRVRYTPDAMVDAFEHLWASVAGR